MLPKRILLAAGVLSAGIYARSEAMAQASAEDTSQTTNACTYAVCALRLEPRYFGPVRLVRGTASESVRLGAWGQDAVPLFRQSDSAAAYGARYVRAMRQGTVVG